eukprot:6178986-Pleurochrysis_carterae.AAC.1
MRGHQTLRTAVAASAEPLNSGAASVGALEAGRLSRIGCSAMLMLLQRSAAAAITGWQQGDRMHAP